MLMEILPQQKQYLTQWEKATKRIDSGPNHGCTTIHEDTCADNLGFSDGISDTGRTGSLKFSSQNGSVLSFHSHGCTVLFCARVSDRRKCYCATITMVTKREINSILLFCQLGMVVQQRFWEIPDDKSLVVVCWFFKGEKLVIPVLCDTVWCPCGQVF